MNSKILPLEEALYEGVGDLVVELSSRCVAIVHAVEHKSHRFGGISL
jgi:hypothetical protein